MLVFKLSNKELELLKANTDKSLKELGLLKVNLKLLEGKEYKTIPSVQKPLKHVEKRFKRRVVSVLHKNSDSSKQAKLI